MNADALPMNADAANTPEPQPQPSADAPNPDADYKDFQEYLQWKKFRARHTTQSSAPKKPPVMPNQPATPTPKAGVGDAAVAAAPPSSGSSDAQRALDKHFLESVASIYAIKGMDASNKRELVRNLAQRHAFDIGRFGASEEDVSRKEQESAVAKEQELREHAQRLAAEHDSIQKQLEQFDAGKKRKTAVPSETPPTKKRAKAAAASLAEPADTVPAKTYSAEAGLDSVFA